MISDGVQASKTPSATACKVVMYRSVLPIHEPNGLKLGSELKGPNANYATINNVCDDRQFPISELGPRRWMLPVLTLIQGVARWL